MAASQYQQLSHEQGLRLLHLLPGTGTLSFLLVEARLDHLTTSYEALSYTWGQSPAKHLAWCEGHVLRIQQNLDLALRRLRRTEEARILWVDAICINQHDLEEKVAQIALMRHIYQRASGVLVWLGESDDTTELAFEHARTLAADGYSARQTTSSMARNSSQIDPWNVRYNALLALFQRPWFTRIWVVQEVTVSPITVVLCGSHSMPWEVLGCAAKRVELDKRASYKMLFEQVDKYRAGSREDLLHLAIRYHEYNATNPRDKLFALQGLAASDSVLADLAEYRCTPADLFRKGTMRWIQAARSLDLLGCVDSRTKTAELPSWVPDWSRSKPSYTLSFTSLFADWTPEYAASAKSEHVPIDSPISDELIVTGILVDTLVDIGVESEISAAAMTPRFGNWRKWVDGYAKGLLHMLNWESVSGVRRGGQYATAGDDISDVYWKTLCGGCKQKVEKDLRGEFLDFDADMRSIQYLHTLGLASSHFVVYFLIYGFFVRRYSLHKLPSLGISNIPRQTEEWPFKNRLIFTHGRRMAATARGYLGLFPEAALKGDAIWILQGARVPFVLRQVEGNDHWTVVGEAYVHGMMSGELYHEDRCQTVFLR